MANEHDAERRQRINQTDEILPGDKQRADDEEAGKFDALDTGNFSTETFGENQSDPDERQQINQSDEKLPGDKQRAKDDERTDSGENKHKATKDSLENPQLEGEGATQGADDSVITAGEATGGGTPIGGGSQAVHESGIDGSITGSEDETNIAERAFGGSATGYGQSDTPASTRAASGAPYGGGTAGGMATTTTPDNSGAVGMGDAVANDTQVNLRQREERQPDHIIYRP